MLLKGPEGLLPPDLDGAERAAISGAAFADEGYRYTTEEGPKMMGQERIRVMVITDGLLPSKTRPRRSRIRPQGPRGQQNDVALNRRRIPIPGSCCSPVGPQIQ
jgi:hypothetical protein